MNWFPRLACAVIVAVSVASLSWADGPPERISVLFLGDNGHHQPALRFRQLQPVMASRGIDLTYSDDVDSLNSQTLANYHGLIVYANIDRISPEQEAALLDYVAGGKGFIPIHCASYCFLNSPKYIELLGAQFQRHTTGVFRTRVVAAEHPVTWGYGGFESWDETYTHHQHNPDRTVLEVRVDGQQREPWTWVRTHGQGRVFYTAWGHDSRTWGNPGFHNLIERGIRWAVGGDPDLAGPYSDQPAMTKIGADAAPFDYVEAKVPFYPAGERWDAIGNPITKMQQPLPPEASMTHASTPSDLDLQLFAAEPEIGKPICLNWDERGRLWVCETVDYPNELQPEGKGRDRIRICEDTTGDGRADKFTIFADKLSIPTSLTFAYGGVVVHQAPHTLFLKDTTGDDVADVRQVLFTGWSTGDTHAGPSNLQWGLDNWLYGMVGYAGFEGQVGGERHSFRTGFYRFRFDDPTNTAQPRVELEFLRNTNNNSWGVGFNEEGELFGSTANGNPSVHLPIPNRYYERVRGWSSSVLGSIAIDARFHPITDKVRQVDHHGRFTAAAGHSLYTARTYPPIYWNQTAFVNGPTGHLTATFLIQPDGASFITRNAWNLLASQDEWAAPIVAEVGPDGHVWVIDWYNYIVQHNPTPVGYKTGKGNAYETDLRDKRHGRVYRLVYRDADAPTALSLAAASPEQLVDTLRHPNMFWRRHAQRLLVERGQRDVVPALIELVRDPGVDAIGLNPGAIHALWTLHGLDALDGSNAEATQAAVAALRHRSAGVRRNAVQVLPRGVEAMEAIVASGLLEDANPRVQLAALLALADLPPRAGSGDLRTTTSGAGSGNPRTTTSRAGSGDPRTTAHGAGAGDPRTATSGAESGDPRTTSITVADALVTAMRNPVMLQDRWLADGLTSAAASFDTLVLRRLAEQSFDRPPHAQALLIAQRIAEHWARGAATDELNELLPALAHADPRIGSAIVAGWFAGWPKQQPARLTDEVEQSLVGLMRLLPAGSRSQLVSLADRWGATRLEQYAAEIAESLAVAVANEKLDEKVRIEAAQQWIAFRPHDAAAVKQMLRNVTPRTSPELAQGLVEAAGKSQAEAAGEAIVGQMAAMTPAVRLAALRALLDRTEWTMTLLEAIAQNRVQLSELSLDQKQRLAAHPHPPIAGQAEKLLASGGGLPNPDRQRVLDELMPLAERVGDVAAGKQVFVKQCAKCHTYQGEGTQIGPDLTGMAVHPKKELLTHIIDPSRSVEGNFRVYTVVTDDGRIMSGLLASETKTTIEMFDAEGKRHVVQRDEVDELIASPKSLMPDGFEKQVSPDDIVNLLEFLTQRGRFLPVPLDKVATIVSTRGMFYSEDAGAERLIFPDWSPKTVGEVPFVLVDPQGERRRNVILLYGPSGKFPPTMPRSVSLPCNTPAKAIHLLSGVSGWGHPVGQKGSVSMIVRLRYSDGTEEDHSLKNGEHFADYIRRVDVPNSQFAFALRGQQIRYLAIHPRRSEKIETIELVKGPDATAPIVMAVTIETR